MSFLRVNDLLLVCIVQNNDVDWLLYIIKHYVFIENKQEIAVGKVCLLVVEDFGSLDWKWRQNLSQHMGHIMPKYGWKV